MIGICSLGTVFATISFSQAINARHIDMADDSQFARVASRANVDRKSIVELESLAQKAISANPPQIDLAKEANEYLLQQKKACLSCENRTVFLDQFENGRLTNIGITALARSYELSPYGEEELMKWRLGIAAHHWSDLDEDLRKATLRQITALAQRKVNRQWLVYQFETDIPEIRERITRLRTQSERPT